MRVFSSNFLEVPGYLIDKNGLKLDANRFTPLLALSNLTNFSELHLLVFLFTALVPIYPKQ